MNFIGDEVLEVEAGTPVTLSKTFIDNLSGSRATRAVIWNHDQGDSSDSTVGMRFVADPVAVDWTFWPLAMGEERVIDGYDCLKNLQIILIGADTAELFVQYFVV